MLGWLTAAALPWLINLWSRNRYEETPWAAIDLLLEALRHESRRLRVQNWLLLAIRTALLAALALAVAQPWWRTAGAGPISTGAVHRVVVMDCSLSMATVSDGLSRLERAQTRARDLIGQMASGDAISVIAWGAEATDLLGRPVQDKASALTAIASIEQQDTHNLVAPALATVEAALARAREDLPHAPAAEVVWLTDRAESTWSAVLATDDSAPGELAQRWSRLCEQASQAFPMPDDGVLSNVAVTDVQLDPPLAVAGAAASIAVTLSHWGGDSARDVAVELRAGNAVVDSRSIELPQAEALTVRFALDPLAPGQHAWEVRIVGVAERQDGLLRDDVRRLAADALPRVRVAVIADSPAAGDDMARALNPVGPAAPPQTPDVARFAMANFGTAPLSDYAALVLCDIATPTPHEAAVLRRYVDEGGAVWLVLGDRVDASAYNQLLGPDAGGDAALLPMKLAAASAGGPWRLDPRGYEHRIVRPFEGRERAGLAGVAVLQYMRLDPWNEGAGPAAEVALGLDNGDPLLVLGNYGHGRVALLATDPALRRRVAADSPWTNLAISPSFVPLVQRTVEWLLMRARVDQFNLLAGEAMNVPTGLSAVAKWHTPAGDFATAPPTNTAGFYYATSDQPSVGAGGATRVFAVNIDSRESDLSALGAELLAGVDEQAPTQSAPATPPSVADSAKPLSWLLLTLAFALLLGERAAVLWLGRSSA